MRLTCAVVLFTSLVVVYAQTPKPVASRTITKSGEAKRLTSDPNRANDDMPIGTIIAFAGPDNLIPDGWLVCNGATVSKGNFPELFNIIQGYWGPYDPVAGIFTLPDLRGVFLRGVTGTRNDQFADPEVEKRIPKPGKSQNEVGSYQRDEFQGHYHNLYARKTIPQGGPQNNTDGGDQRNGFFDNDVRVTDPSNDGKDGEPRFGKETRPANAYVFYIIKASSKKPAAALKKAHP